MALTLMGVVLALLLADDLAQWFKRRFKGRAPAAGAAEPDDVRQDRGAHDV